MRQILGDLTWSDFEAGLKRLQDVVRAAGGDPSTLLFRGQSNSEYKLTTTLERAGGEGLSFSRYYHLISKVRPAVESLTASQWDMPDWSTKVIKKFREVDSFQGPPTDDGTLDAFPSGPIYRYMVYLRHHGFPSPLLDWSSSPYVAAFFAFRDPAIGVAERSIYAYWEVPQKFKAWSNHMPMVRPIGRYVRGHPRHFRQQSDYTICGFFRKEWHFHSHEGVFSPTEDVSSPDGPRKPPDYHEQDSLYKFNLVSTERDAVLSRLDDYNLNAFSLFDSEETLMETMWSRVAPTLKQDSWIDDYREDGEDVDV